MMNDDYNGSVINYMGGAAQIVLPQVQIVFRSTEKMFPASPCTDTEWKVQISSRPGKSVLCTSFLYFVHKQSQKHIPPKKHRCIPGIFKKSMKTSVGVKFSQASQYATVVFQPPGFKAIHRSSLRLVQ